MKRMVYLAALVLLGILVQFLAHALIEIWYIGLLLKDFGTYGLGLSWERWVLIHDIGTVLFLVAGILFGYWQGKYWWQKIYID